GGAGVIVALEGHVGDGQLGQPGELRIGEVVPDRLEEARGLEVVLVLHLPHASFVGASGVARGRAGDRLGDVGIAARAGAEEGGAGGEKKIIFFSTRHLRPTPSPAPLRRRPAGVPSRSAPAGGGAFP